MAMRSEILPETQYRKFWAAQARQKLTWIKDFHTTLDWKEPYADWFLGGVLNACYNCLDRHVEGGAGSRTALRWEGDGGETLELSFRELLEQVCRLANVFKRLGIERGDRIAVYLPEIPELVVAMLACARIGAVHSVIQHDLSSDSLADRINDATAVLLLTADGYYRNGEEIPLSVRYREALTNTPSINNVVVVKRIGAAQSSQQSSHRSGHHWYHELMSESDSGCRPEPLASEDLLYLLYSPGATGAPKGIMHTTAGFLTQAAFSCAEVFHVQPEADLFWCTMDTASAPGHAYGVYGALLHGMCTLLLESPLYERGAAHVWSAIERHGVSQLYISPASLRQLADPDEPVPEKCDLSSLRIIATFGAPLQTHSRRWLANFAKERQCAAVDTWWQTETGALMLAGPVTASGDAESAVVEPLPGIEVEVVNQEGVPVSSQAGELIVTLPWPAMLRGIWDDPLRYRELYWSGAGTGYYSGDFARRSQNGGIRILGHSVDLLNTGLERTAPIEIEALLDQHESVAESVVVGFSPGTSGTADRLVGFAVLEPGIEASDELAAELADFVNEMADSSVHLDRVLLVPAIPRTSDGRHMRRLLRDVAADRSLGDTTALADPELINEIRARAAFPENWCWNNGPFAPGRIAIVDIDGVVADAFYRMHGKSRNFDRTEEYFKGLEADDVIEEVARLLELFRDEVRIVLLTARPLCAQDLTVRWLKRHGVRWDLLIMRATGSMQMPVNHKRHRTKELLERGFEPLIALEDDPRNVEMFQQEGIPTLYVHSRIHGEDND